MDWGFNFLLTIINFSSFFFYNSLCLLDPICMIVCMMYDSLDLVELASHSEVLLERD